MNLQKLLLLVLSSTFLFIFSASAYAGSLSLGATVWYTRLEVPVEGVDDLDLGPDFMYGPNVSYSFSDKWNFGFQALYGVFNEDVDYGITTVSYKSKRLDMDATVTYRLLPFLGIYAGGKIMSLELEGKYDSETSSEENISGGPAMGISLTQNVMDLFYLLGNASCIYTFNLDDTSEEPLWGSNLFGGAAVYIGPINTVLSFGYRYQKIYDDSGSGDTVYKGLIASVIYNF